MNSPAVTTLHVVLMQAFVLRVCYRMMRVIVLSMRHLQVVVNVQRQNAVRKVKALLSKERETGEK